MPNARSRSVVGAALGALRRTPLLGALVPVDTLEQALDAAAAEAARGVRCTLAYLGGDPGAGDAAAVRPYRAAAEALASRGIDGELSVKLSMLGAGIGAARCEERLRTLLAAEAEPGTRVWVDGEAPETVEGTLALVGRVRRDHPRLGTTLQACLRRSAADLEGLIATGAPVRLVKGSFRPVGAAAYRGRAAVASHFVRLASRLLDPDARAAGAAAVFATHDLALLRRLQDLAWSRGLGRDAFEWHALRGLRASHQARLAREGYPVRTLVSYGPGWLRWYAGLVVASPARLWAVGRALA